MKKTKTKIIILLGLFVFILFISFYFKKEGADFTEYINKGPRYSTVSPTVYDYGSYKMYGNLAQNTNNCKQKCSDRPDCKGVINADRCYLSKTINKQTPLIDNIIIKNSYADTFIKV